MADQVLRYRNRPVEELTKEELVAAMYRMMALLEEERARTRFEAALVTELGGGPRPRGSWDG